MARRRATATLEMLASSTEKFLENTKQTIGRSQDSLNSSPSHLLTAPNSQHGTPKKEKRRASIADILAEFTEEKKSWIARTIDTFDPGRDNVLSAVYKQERTRNRILESYRRVKNALKAMQDHYVTSKESKNFFARYAMLKIMVKEVIVLEKQYWQLLDIPKQEASETPNDYVNRIMAHLDERCQDAPAPTKTGIAGLLGSTASLAEKSKDATLAETLKSKSTDELKKDNDRLYSDIFRLMRKYQTLREIVHDLRTQYDSSKAYPIIPRYSMLKNMIKATLRAPGFAEVCHEMNE